MDIRNLVNPTHNNPPTNPVSEQPAGEPGIDDERPFESGVAPGVRPELPLQTRRLQQALSIQFPAPAVSAIPGQTQHPPTPARPLQIDLKTLKAMPTSAHRVKAVVDRFEALWNDREWASLHTMLKQLAQTYPKNIGNQLLPELNEAIEVINDCKIIISVFLKGSGHCYCNSALSTPWMQLLRDQGAHNQDAASLLQVITHGPLSRYNEDPMAVHATMVQLSWLLPVWKMRSAAPTEHTTRIALAMIQLFERLDQLHATRRNPVTEKALLNKIVRSVKAPYCSPQMRDTLRACAAAVPEWLQRPLSAALMNIDKDEGADLYPPNELDSTSQQNLTALLNRLRNGETAQKRGRKVPRTDALTTTTTTTTTTNNNNNNNNNNNSSSEPAPKRLRLDALAHMPPGSVPGSAFSRTGTQALWFAVPGTATHLHPGQARVAGDSADQDA